MNMNLRNYVKVYDNFLDKDFCDQILKSLEGTLWGKHYFYEENTKTERNYENDLSVSYNNSPEEKTLEDKIWHAIYNYITIDNKDLNEWFNGWNGYSKIRFNKYDEKTEMRLHCDHITTLFQGDNRGIPLLSIVGTLNEDYSGGDFIMWESEKISLKTGSLLIFPSNFLYPHRITPVTQGTRYSYVSWVW
jgi:predicted 2-oxoglutarate/Fe(II)-dependent dioxygenase YbiX